MNNKSRLLVLIGSGLFVVILIVVITSLAMAQAGTPQGSAGESVIPNLNGPLAPVPGGPGFVSLSPFALKNHSYTEAYAYSGQMLYNPTQFLSLYEGPLALPHGATITKFVVYFYDNDPSQDIIVSLSQGPFTDGYTSPIVQIQSTSYDPNNLQVLEAIPTSNNVVDNQNNTYSVETYLPSSPNIDVALVGVRVDYAYPGMLPLIQK